MKRRFQQREAFQQVLDIANEQKSASDEHTFAHPRVDGTTEGESFGGLAHELTPDATGLLLCIECAEGPGWEG